MRRPSPPSKSTDLDMRARRFELAGSLSHQQTFTLIDLLKSHPGLEAFETNTLRGRFTVRMKDENYWSAAGNNVLELIKNYLASIGKDFKILTVHSAA